MGLKSIGLGLLALLSVAAGQNKPVIRTEADLPPTRFSLAMPPSEIIDQPAYIAMLPALRAEAERLLSDYDIQDRTLVQSLRLGLANIAVLQGRKLDAQTLVAAYRAGEAKPQRKLLAALNLDLAATMLNLPPDQRCSAAVSRMSALLAGADPMVVRDEFIDAVSNIQVASLPYYAGGAVGSFDPIFKRRGSLDLIRGLAIARWRVAATMLPPCREPLVVAARRWIDDPKNAPVDIWPERQPDDSAFTGAKPVVVAVWDRGYDVTLFPGQLARDPAEPLDGRDNDGNGIVDDSNGPTYDLQLRPRDGAMALPTQFLQRQLAAQMAFDKGELDLRFGFDTPEAEMFAAFSRTASTRAQADEFLGFMENRGRVHGTACASEIADGAPFVRLYNIAALPWGRGEDREDVPYDEATIARWASVIDRITLRIRGAGVRVVSMSWGLTADEAGQQLIDHGLETDPVRAKARGLAMRKTIADALHRMMIASPNTLFVVAAGNSDQDDEIQADAVQTFSSPNMLIVGATGSNGRPTAFTVTGTGVQIYARGEAVRLRWPGNIVVHASGTSMSAPLVARAAAQMLAIKPSLTGAQLRTGLLASTTMEQGGLRLLHPAASVAWAKRH